MTTDRRPRPAATLAEAEYRARATAIQHVRDDMLALFEACEEEG